MKWLGRKSVPEPKADIPTNGGNSFVINKELEAQTELNNSTIPNAFKLANVKNKKSLKNTIEEIESEIKNTTPQPWFLLQYEANYFCNRIKYNCSNTYFNRIIKEVVRAAFFNGQAGIYKLDDKTYIPVVIIYEETDVFGFTTKLKLQPTCNYYSNLEIKYNNSKNSEKDGFIELTGTDVMKVAKFQWNTNKYSCFIWLWPIIKQFYRDLVLINVDAYSFVKKFNYRIADPSQSGTDLKNFYDPFKPFITTPNDMDISNIFEQLDIAKGQGGSDIIRYFNEKKAIYYSYIGRRINTNDKLERNVSDEIKASQENFDILERETLDYFIIFIDELKTLNQCLEVDIWK